MKTTTDKATMVPMEVVYQPAWLTWVASVTGCLKALGLDVDTTDVAAYSSYAFVMSVHEELCPSGPTVFDWGQLTIGINFLGRSTLCHMTADCHTGEHINDRTRAHCRYVYEVVEKEIREGRPCVIWGTYVPEFGIAVGVEDGKYHVKTFKECIKEEQPPIPYDGIDAPGGPYVLAFPTPTGHGICQWGDEWALRKGLRNLRAKGDNAKYGYGLDAYNFWVRALESGKANAHGAAFNAQCWAEAKRFIREFLTRAAGRNEKPAGILKEAITHYDTVCAAMDEVAKLFPFPPGDQVKDEKIQTAAMEYLKKAQEAEVKAVDAMSRAVEISWGE